MNLRLSSWVVGALIVAAALLLPSQSWAVYYPLGPSSNDWAPMWYISGSPKANPSRDALNTHTSRSTRATRNTVSGARRIRIAPSVASALADTATAPFPFRFAQIPMSFHVTLQPSGRQYNVGDDETLLTAAIREGIGLPYGCKDGACGSCKCKLVEGRVIHTAHQAKALSEAEEAAGLYADPSAIGYRRQWEHLLASKALKFEGHQLISKG